MRAIICVAACALTACSTANWQHSSRGQQAFYADSNACSVQAQQAFPQQPMAVQPRAPFTYPTVADAAARGLADGYNAAAAARQDTSRQQFYENCLRAQGWYTVNR